MKRTQFDDVNLFLCEVEREEIEFSHPGISRCYLRSRMGCSQETKGKLPRDRSFSRRTLR
jgi:hypothetical protein